MTKTEVIASVASDLNATEQAVDEAIVRATPLVQSLIGARTALGISPVVGADSQAKVLEAIACLSTARQAMVVCHAELAKDHRRMGYGAYAEKPLDKGQGDDRTVGAVEHRLRAV